MMMMMMMMVMMFDELIMTVDDYPRRRWNRLLLRFPHSHYRILPRRSTAGEMGGRRATC